MLPREYESWDEVQGWHRRLMPTPMAGDAKSAANRTAGRSDPDSKHHDGVTLTDAVRMLPTPLARDGGGRGASTVKYRKDLERGAGPNLDDTMLALHRGVTTSRPSDATNELSDDGRLDLWTTEDD